MVDMRLLQVSAEIGNKEIIQGLSLGLPKNFKRWTGRVSLEFLDGSVISVFSD